MERHESKRLCKPVTKRDCRNSLNTMDSLKPEDEGPMLAETVQDVCREGIGRMQVRYARHYGKVKPQRGNNSHRSPHIVHSRNGNETKRRRGQTLDADCGPLLGQIGSQSVVRE
jgi:hypothetical protein